MPITKNSVTLSGLENISNVHIQLSRSQKRLWSSGKVKAGYLIEGNWSESLGFDSRKCKRKKKSV